MVAIPTNVLDMNDLLAWDTAKTELAKWKAKEMLLRLKIFKTVFPEPKEGTNSYTLPSGYTLKGGYKLSRDIDPGELFARQEQFREAGISDGIIKRVPTLVKTEYNKLTDEQRKVFDNALIIKPGTPTLEIFEPSKRGKVGD